MILFFYYSKLQDQVRENTWRQTRLQRYRPSTTILSCWTWRELSDMAFRLFRIRLPRYMFDNKSHRYLLRHCFHIGRKLVRPHLQIILQDQDPSRVFCAFVDDDMQDDQEWSVLQLLSRVEKLSSLQSKKLLVRFKNRMVRTQIDPNQNQARVWLPDPIRPS